MQVDSADSISFEFVFFDSVMSTLQFSICSDIVIFAIPFENNVSCVAYNLTLNISLRINYYIVCAIIIYLYFDKRYPYIDKKNIVNYKSIRTIFLQYCLIIL